MPINVQKCQFANSNLNWLNTILRRQVIRYSKAKQPILTVPPPNTLKQLRSFLGSVHYISNFIQNLEQICHPLQTIIKKATKFLSTETHPERLNIIKDKIAQSTEIYHFNPNLDVSVKCDASRSGPGSALEQNTPGKLRTIACESRFLNGTYERYSVCEIESLRIV